MGKMKRLVAICAVVGLLAAVLRPRPARADTEEAFILAGIALTAYVAFVVVGTLVANRDRPILAPTSVQSDIEMARTPAEHGVRFGGHCTQTPPSTTLVCW